MGTTLALESLSADAGNGDGACEESRRCEMGGCGGEEKTMTEKDTAELIENLDEWADHFRQDQHGVTLSLLRAIRAINEMQKRIGERDDARRMWSIYQDKFAEAQELLSDVERGHRNPDDGQQYNNCESPKQCKWCARARKLLPN